MSAGAVVAWILAQEDIQLAPYTLLDVAASTSDPEVLRLLIATGLGHSSAALLRAVQCGNLAFLAALLATGVHPDSEVALHGGPRYGGPRCGGTRGTAVAVVLVPRGGRGGARRRREAGRLRAPAPVCRGGDAGCAQ